MFGSLKNGTLFTLVLICGCWLVSTSQADERYYMVIFAYDGPAHQARQSHTFATFVKVRAETQESNVDPVNMTTISWMPATLNVAPLRRYPEPGKNLDLRSSLQVAMAGNARISAWGPFQVRKELFDRALIQTDRLNRGLVAYKALDRKYRPGSASNCFHAVSDITEDPLLHVGAAYGEAASRMVVGHLSRWVINPQEKHLWLLPGLELDRYPIHFKN